MSVFTYEWKKIMTYQRGLLYCLAALLIGVVLLVLTDTPQSSAIEQYRCDYEWYLEKLDGAYSEEKSAFLEREAQAITEARNSRSKVQGQYYDGQMTRVQYDRELAEINAVLEHENGFDAAYQQYLYICEGKDNRFFVQTNGWAGLLGGMALDFPTFLATLLLATSVFCSEYSCQMDTLLRTSRESQKSVRYKVLIALCSVLALCLTMSLIRYVFFAAKYGLPHGSYPIQSIRLFENSTKEISLLGAYLTVTVLRCFGYVYLTALLLFFSVLAKKYALTVICGAISTLIPYIGLSKTVIVRLPLPLPFMLATDFLVGNTYAIDSLTGESVLSLLEITTSEILAFLAFSAVICFLCVWEVLRRNTNCWRAGKRTAKRYGALLLGLLLLLTASGCTKSSMEGVVFNLASPTISGGYEVKASPDRSRYTIENSDTGLCMDLVRSPLFGVFSDESAIKSVYMSYPYIYYIISKTEQAVDRVGSYNSTVTQVSIMELNVETYQERVIFEKTTNSGHSVLGVEYTVGDTWMFLQYIYGFFLNEDYFFFVTNQGITEVDRVTHRMTRLDIPTDGNIAFDGESIFYLNRDSLLTVYHTKSRTTNILDHIVAYDFCLTEKGIYYIDRTNSNSVCWCACDGTNITKVSDTPAISVSYDGERVTMIARADGQEVVIGSCRNA